MTPPEFHRPERIEAIGDAVRSITVIANTAECAALAARFDLIEVTALTGHFAVRRDADVIVVTGRVAATVVQACVATGDPVVAAIDEPVTLRFVHDVGTDEEIELGSEDCDVIAHDGSVIDLGEATAETMALALDPFPRRADADAVLRAAGVLREDDAGPVGALAGLGRALMEKKQQT